MSELEQEVEQEEVEQEVEQEESTMDDSEKEARGYGWIDRDEWVESGKDPSEWSDYKAFNKNSSLFSRIKDLEKATKSHEEEVANLNTFHKLQMEQTIAELTSQKEDAIKDGDVNLVNKLDEQIDNVKSGTENPDTSQAILDSWNDDNPWIFEDTPKSRYAHNAYNVAMRNGKSTAEALAEVETKVAEKYAEPEVNQRRNEKTGIQGKQGGKKDAITLSSMTAQEESIMNNPLFANFSEEQKLKMLRNSRK